ncbi:hypothetical protein BHM03_00020544 [Ensete ventricosum]|nr:hypothetical protein BHM03_00020544 [Ensete ventricosum]
MRVASARALSSPAGRERFFSRARRKVEAIVHHAIGRLWLLFRIFFFMIKALFWMFKDLFFNEFNHKKSPFFTAMLAAPRLVAMPT